MKKTILCLLLLSTFVFINGCIESFMPKRYVSTLNESKVIALTGQTDFTLGDPNGKIIITSSDTAKNIYCKITKEVRSRRSTSDAKAHLSDININTSRTGTGVKIKVEQPGSSSKSYKVNFDIILPEDFNCKVSLGNGNVTVNSSSKNLSVNIGNGKADIGSVLKDNSDVSISIGNGAIDFVIPGSTNAVVYAGVGNGKVSSSGLSFRNSQSSSRTLRGTLGSGSGSIHLSVGNGSIHISEK